MNTPTPRTDEATYPMNEVDIVWPDFARTLERELAAAKAECERLKFALVEWEAKERGWSKAVEKDAAELSRLRAEVERWQGTAATMTAEREHNANEAGRLRSEVERLNDIINRASVQFFRDGTDGETTAKMFTVLNEAKP